MDARTDAPSSSPPAQPPRLRALLPPGDPLGAEEFVDALGLEDLAAGPAERPYVMLNMASTVDGRTSIGGTSGAIGNRADRALFHGLRGVVDAVMAGAGTVRAERYGPIVPDEQRRRRRIERGLAAEPIACIVSGRAELPGDLPLLADPAARVLLITASQTSLAASAAEVQYIRAERAGALDLTAALAQLRSRFAVRSLLCEGGPHLNMSLLSAGLVDELFLSLAPKLAGGMAGDQALRILAGPELPDPASLKLLSVLESESALFLRYRVRASAPASVSRDTIASSSLAS